MASLDAGLSVRRREEVRVSIDSFGKHLGILVRGTWDRIRGYKSLDGLFFDAMYYIVCASIAEST